MNFKIIGFGIIGVVIAVAISLFINAWLVMIALGISYHELAWPKHAIGYWPSMLVALAIAIIAGLFRNSQR